MGVTALKVTLPLILHPREPYAAATLSFSVVVPCYNEPDDALEKTLRSIAEQSLIPFMVFVVDDGSTEGDAKAIVDRLGPELPCPVRFQRQQENRGKRSALVWAFEHIHHDVVVTVDSDTILDPHAFENLLLPFTDERVMATTGRIAPRNAKANLLTRFQSMVYARGALNDRATYSLLAGSVLVCSGALAAYRPEIVRPYVKDFMKYPRMYGEDRHLTLYALMKGRVMFAGNAIAHTEVPDSVRRYVRQQMRWQRGYHQLSIWALRWFPLNHRAFWLYFIHVAVWVCAIVLSLVWIPYAFIDGRLSVATLAYVALIAYGTLAHYSRDWGTFLMAPVLGFAHTLFMLPIVIYTALTFQREVSRSRTGARSW